MRAIILAVLTCLAAYAETKASGTWNAKSAAAYLDQRANWWITWKPAQRDQDTFCISCHTSLPYTLARPALRNALGERELSVNERAYKENIVKRVRLWDSLQPLYSDKSGPNKSTESRGTEAVFNALVLVNYDAPEGKLSDDTRHALKSMWDLQLTSGENKGGFAWMNFHYQPWEAGDSAYWGASLAALAVGSAPGNYREAPEVSANVRLLIDYLQKHQQEQSLANRVTLLWASTKLPGLLDAAQRKSIIDEVLAKQQEDGGWSTSSLVEGNWKRVDATPLETKSDGYGTGLVTFVLERAGVPRNHAQLKRSLLWLEQNQDKDSGLWPAYSLNKKRDPASDVGRFMSDAATAFSVLALSEPR